LVCFCSTKEVSFPFSKPLNRQATKFIDAHGRGATSKMRCVDVAALFAAAILRRNPDSIVIPFDTRAYDAKMDPSDSILSIADRLSKYGGGGTNSALPLEAANCRPMAICLM
jgi:hypothetical protein